jgi:N-acetylglucosaminyl-diphospho-decaprenol L-rhamnosyltransferase
MKKSLTIIIVTFNSSEVIGKCLENLDADKYDILVIDNASSDDTCKIVENSFPKVEIIRNDKNLGYGRANNIGLRQANTDFALILNPDAFIFEEDIKICLDLLKKNQDIALANTKTFQNIDQSNAAKLQEPLIQNINFSFGGVLFMNMSIFRKIGFFDENFFMFAEDNELSDRAIKNGYRNVIINAAKSFHSGGGSSKKNLRNTYRRFWHLGWSKSKYKQAKKGKLQTIRITARLTIIYFCEGIFYLLVGNINKSVGKFAFASGCFSFLIGLKAFKKDGTPRG